jgi:Transmembrane secretion effector
VSHRRDRPRRLQSFSPLRHRNYAHYWVGFAASNTGRHVEIVGSVWLAYELTGSPLLVGLFGLARAVPSIVFTPIAGVVADRVDQRHLLLLTQGLACTMSLGLGALVIAGVIEVWHLYLQVAVQSIVTAFDAVARQSLFPRLVPRSELPQAVTLSVTAARVSKLIGPALGGLCIAALGEASPFIVNGVTFLALMAAVLRMRGVAPVVGQTGASMGSDLLAGFSHLWTSPVLNGLFRLEVVFSLLQMNEVMIAIIAREFLDVGPEGLGVLLAAPALGSVLAIGALLVVGPSRREGRLIVVSMLAYAVALVALAAARNFALAFALLAVIGIFDALSTVARHSISQLVAPAELRGRVMANMGVVTRGIGPLAQTQSGALAGLIGAPLAVVVAAVGVAGATAYTARNNPALWRFRHDAAPPDVSLTE